MIKINNNQSVKDTDSKTEYYYLLINQSVKKVDAEVNRHTAIFVRINTYMIRINTYMRKYISGRTQKYIKRFSKTPQN